nr:TPA: cytochrome c oxidase subunit II [Cylicobdellidae sp. FA-2019]
MPFWNQMMMQDAMSPVMAKISFFHDSILLVMIMVLTIIGYTMVMLSMNTYTNRFTFEAQEIETIWTILPALILIFLALPSIQILYMIDESINPLLTIKAIGHQWYWSYQYGDFPNIEFDSYMIPSEDLVLGDFRLLEVDNRLILPMNMEIRIIVSATDVIHSWTIPSIGIKLDAIPGRLNQACFMVNMSGVFYGQCSEICGANHSFMPIALEVINNLDFMMWLNKY